MTKDKTRTDQSADQPDPTTDAETTGTASQDTAAGDSDNGEPQGQEPDSADTAPPPHPTEEEVTGSAGSTADDTGESSDAADDSDYPEDGTVQDVKDWVGDDPDRARTALDRENSSDSPRSTLVSALESKVS